jgi:hypothetical protein
MRTARLHRCTVAPGRFRKLPDRFNNFAAPGVIFGSSRATKAAAWIARQLEPKEVIMTRTFIAAAIATAIAAPAMASDQLAHAAGVEPGVYSTAELTRMIRALEENDAQTYRFVRDGGAEIVSSQSPAIGGANAQLARAAGVEQGVYSTAELTRMVRALEENDARTYRFVRDGSMEIVSSQSPGTSPSDGKARLAASLGVDADDYTLGQLAGMYIDAHD